MSIGQRRGSLPVARFSPQQINEVYMNFKHRFGTHFLLRLIPR
jgi:hypothetical protein